MNPLRAFLPIFLVSSFLYPLEITVNYGKENSKNFSVLNIKNNTPFGCLEKFDYEGRDYLIECVIDSIPQEGFTPVKTMFFEFYYRMINGKFHLFIEPRKKQKLFPIPNNIKKDIEITKEKPTMSKDWQIIGYEDQVPFLSNQKSRGINFPILIPDAQTPFIPQLDINNEPLDYSKGFDFDLYMKAKALMQKKSYYNALSVITETLKQYPDTIFKKDLYLYQIIALSGLNQKQQDVIIEMATNWIKQFPNDWAIPQVLYILGKAYADIHYRSESQEYYKRIIQEYPQNRYAPLAKMQLAIDLTNNSSTGLATIYFQEAYSQAKDLESASEIAVNWAVIEIKKQNPKLGAELIEKVLHAYPQFFIQDSQKTYKLVDFLEKNKLYKDASDIAQYLSDNTQDAQIKEQISYDLGKLYANANEFDKAHQANLDYIKEYPNNPEKKSVKIRDDNILFDVSGSNEEKFERYDYIINKYPNTKQSQKALQLKAQLFIDEKKYKSVLDMRKELGEKSPLLQTAINSLIKIYLEKHDCKNANIYLTQTTQYDLNESEKLEAFDCLYKSSLNKNAQIISEDMAKEAKNTNQKLAWLCRDANNLYQLGDYKSSVLAARDAFSLALSSKSSQYIDVGFTLFFDLVKLGNKKEALKIYSELAKKIPDNQKMIKVYSTLLDWASQEKNDTSLQIYAQNIITLQNKYKTDEFTPYAEFELINSLIRTKKLKEAQNQINSLLVKKLDKEETQKALYLKGSVYNLENDVKNATTSFNQCLQIQAQSPWETLCKQGLELFKQ